VTDGDPTLKCVECGWKGVNTNSAPGLCNEIRMAELQHVSKLSESKVGDYEKQIWQELSKPKKGELDGNSER
jgi:hypothetical protein